MHKYLPSRKFMAGVLFISVIIILFFVGKLLFKFIKEKRVDKSNTKIELTVGKRLQKDSNDNDIPDWEEYLWGLDPTRNGKGNKEYILNKKKTLEANGIIVTDSGKAITDNDLLTRQFFATVISLQQTGELNDDSLKSVSEAVGKNIEATPIPDIYTSSMLNIVSDTKTAREGYENSFSNLVSDYQDSDIGSELTLIIQGISSKDPQALYAAKTVAEAYISFGDKLMKMDVPKSISPIHLSMANNYEKTGQSIMELTRVLVDPLAGMKALVSYKNYSDALAGDLEKLSKVLQ